MWVSHAPHPHAPELRARVETVPPHAGAALLDGGTDAHGHEERRRGTDGEAEGLPGGPPAAPWGGAGAGGQVSKRAG